MFKYKDGSLVKIGDDVLVSKKWRKENGYADTNAKIVDLRGFVTVEMKNGDRIDFDMRSIKKSL